jgi:hypothetical protein
VHYAVPNASSISNIHGYNVVMCAIAATVVLVGTAHRLVMLASWQMLAVTAAASTVPLLRFADTLSPLRYCHCCNDINRGIDVLEFGELLMSSGLVLMDNVTWISFHR